MSSKLNSLYGNITFTNILINNMYAVDITSLGPLFNLQESIWYFANGLPLIQGTGTDNNKYYQTWSSNLYWVSDSYYTSKFALNVNDKSDLTAAYTVVHTLNSNITNNMNEVIMTPAVVDLKNSLQQFTTYSNNLNIAKNNLFHKLSLSGIKLTFDPRFN